MREILMTEVIDLETGPASAAIIPGLVWAFHIEANGVAKVLAPDEPIKIGHDR